MNEPLDKTVQELCEKIDWALAELERMGCSLLQTQSENIMLKAQNANLRKYLEILTRGALQ